MAEGRVPGLKALVDLTFRLDRAFQIHEVPRTVVDSPIGPLGLIASDVGLQAVLFDGRRIRAGADRRSSLKPHASSTPISTANQ